MLIACGKPMEQSMATLDHPLSVNQAGFVEQQHADLYKF